MIRKWSLKAPDHEANRVRNNQRRHRERVKRHIADVEARLAESQLQLEVALLKNAELEDRLRLQEPQDASDSIPLRRAPGLMVQRTRLSLDDSAQLLPSLSSIADLSDAALQSPTPNNDTVAEARERACSNLPPPARGKSTTSCKDAYIIIAQQNYRGLETTAIEAWLEPGYRGAIVKGGGCRVESHLLFALLDFITAS